MLSFFGAHLDGLGGWLVGTFAAWGALTVVGDIQRWTVSRFEHRGWRIRRRWYRPGAYVFTDCGEPAVVLDVDLEGEQPWLRLGPQDENAEPAWLPLSSMTQPAEPSSEDRIGTAVGG